MSQNLDLKAIERKAFRSVHQDGLWDIYLGGLMLVLSLFFAIPESGEGELTYMVIALLGVTVVFAVFQLGKKYITTPRMGQVQFGPERQKRKITLGWIMGAYVLVTLGMVLFSLYIWNRSASGQTVDLALTPSLERVLVALVAALLAGTSTLVISYFREFVRGYYIALLMGLGFFFTLLLDMTIPMLVAGALILVPGLILFVNFLPQHPLPPQEARHGSSRDARRFVRPRRSGPSHPRTGPLPGDGIALRDRKRGFHFPYEPAWSNVGQPLRPHHKTGGRRLRGGGEGFQRQAPADDIEPDERGQEGIQCLPSGDEANAG